MIRQFQNFSKIIFARSGARRQNFKRLPDRARNLRVVSPSSVSTSQSCMLEFNDWLTNNVAEIV